MIQVSLALDHLLDTVAEVAKDMRDEGTKTIRFSSTLLVAGSFFIAFLNLLLSRRRPEEEADRASPRDEPADTSEPRIALPHAPTAPPLRRDTG
jgi:hypothetical protein